MTTEPGVAPKAARPAHAARNLAGIVYALLALLQMLATGFIIQFADITKLYLAYFLVLGSVGLFAGLAAWLLSGGRAPSAGSSASPTGAQPLSAAARRGIVVASLLYAAYQLITHRAQVELIQTALYWLLPAVHQQALVQYAVLLARLLLVVLAAFFALGSRPTEEATETSLAEPVEPLEPQPKEKIRVRVRRVPCRSRHRCYRSASRTKKRVL